MRIAIAEDEAGQLRFQDSDAVLMFVTSMAQYAINGCAVGAPDFVRQMAGREGRNIFPCRRLPAFAGGRPFCSVGDRLDSV